MGKILILSMGGTIDAEAYPDDESLYPVNATPQGSCASYTFLKDKFQKSHEDDFVEYEVERIQICDKDSKDIDDQDIDRLFTNIEDNMLGFSRIIVTIGTDRMTEIGELVKEKFMNPDCSIILTGAIWPLANGPEKSDGYKNMERAALFGGKRLHPDVYVTVGDVFMFAGNVKKDFAAKKFIVK